MKIHLIFFIFILLFLVLSCTDKAVLPPICTSPDGKIEVSIQGNEQDGSLSFIVMMDRDTVIAGSPLGISLAGDSMNFVNQLKYMESKRETLEESYTMETGKQRLRRSHYTQVWYRYSNAKGSFIKIVFRVFNDGVAFRYILENTESSSVTQEVSGYRISDITNVWAIPFSSGDERVFEKSTVRSLQKKALSFPVLQESKAGNWFLISESDVSDFPLSGARFQSDTLNYIFPGKMKGVNEVGSDFHSPWRVAIMGTELASIVESCIIDHLAPPGKLKNASWVEPGIVAFPWWGDNYANSYPESLKRYIDLAAALNWRYIEFDIALVGSPDRAVDKWKTTEWIKDVVLYGDKRGVFCYGWDEIANLDTPEKRQDIFSRYKNLGIVGCKVDFVNSYSQQSRKIVEDIIIDAMKYEIMLSFHGAQAPRGFARTYPHVMTIEAVKGAEYYLEINGGKGLPPSHNCTLPFTRNVLGSMDYTPVAFSSNIRTTSAAHELALAVIFESGWQGMCDVPEAYLNSPARIFLSQLHASWDETKFLAGYPGEYCVLARRKGGNWYVAGINAGDPRRINVDLSPLKVGNKTVTIFTDRESDNKILVEKPMAISDDSPLELSMGNNGGFAFIIKGTNN